MSKLTVTLECVVCVCDDEYAINKRPGDIKDIVAEIDRVAAEHGWIPDGWDGYYCCEDCRDGYDPRSEALTIGERNPGLAGRYE